MFTFQEILETIKMVQEENLDIRTITMGISLRDCADPNPAKARQKIYDKITRLAGNLVRTGENIEREYGLPIVNKRISVTPIALEALTCVEREACKPEAGGCSSTEQERCHVKKQNCSEEVKEFCHGKDFAREE
jgi:uncharacterized protein (UPF0210 family)